MESNNNNNNNNAVESKGAGYIRGYSAEMLVEKFNKESLSIFDLFPEMEQQVLGFFAGNGIPVKSLKSGEKLAKLMFNLEFRRALTVKVNHEMWKPKPNPNTDPKTKVEYKVTPSVMQKVLCEMTVFGICFDGLDMSQIKEIVPKKGASPTYVVFNNCSLTSEEYVELLSRFGNLEILDLEMPRADQISVKMIGKSSTLRRFSLHAGDCPVFDWQFLDPKFVTSLEEVDVQYNRPKPKPFTSFMTSFCKQLKKVTLNGQFADMSPSFPTDALVGGGIVELDLAGYGLDTLQNPNNNITMPQLLTFNLRSAVVNYGLHSIITSASNLQSVVLEELVINGRFPSLWDFAQLKSLQNLELRGDFLGKINEVFEIPDQGGAKSLTRLVLHPKMYMLAGMLAPHLKKITELPDGLIEFM